MTTQPNKEPEAHRLALWCTHLHDATEFRCVELIEDPRELRDAGKTYLCETCDKEVVSGKREIWELDFRVVCEHCVKARSPLLTIIATHDFRE
jgi:hypothetical protein